MYFLLSFENILRVTSILLEYEFKMFSHTVCDIIEERLDTLQDAKDACKFDSKCEGILNHGCGTTKEFSLCQKGSTRTTNAEFQSCVYVKIAIGTINIFR